MWLLSTDRAELHYFARNFDAVGGYAILSHTWDGNEKTLQQVRAIVERCRANSTNPRDDAELSPKIRECCILAERDGYRWVWIDSCCIDKMSSSELSEAINSMYQWYKEAEVCYAYLADVPSDCVLNAPESAFRKSRWHTRGWTLQELIAPDFVIFLSADWRELGNKAALAKLLQEITHIDSRVLTRSTPIHLSIAVRMSWASSRKTTRVEDEAYCLMGLFGVSMPTNYGEGKRAFIRLQYEIMQHDSDPSLFMFGSSVKQGRILTFHPQDPPNHRWQYLMADSPRELNHGFGYIPDLGTNAKQEYPPPLDSTTTSPFDAVELPSATVTSYGIQFRLPVYEADGITIAVTLCQGSARGHHFGLFLTRDNQGKDPKRPRYFTGCVYQRPSTTGTATYVARIADLGDDLYNLTFNGKRVEATWRTIYVVPTASDFDSEGTTPPNLMINCNPASRFRVPRWLIARFTALQFVVNQFRNTKTLQVVRMRTSKARIFVSFGSCTEHQDPDKPPLLWAKVDVVSLIDMSTFTHGCSEDHLDAESWATRSKVFGDADRKVRLSLTPSTRMSENVLVIHLELFGRFFEAILREAGVPSLFPSLADLERDAPHPAPTPNDPVTSSQPRSPSQLESIASWGPSSAAASNTSTTSHTRPSRIPRLVSTRRLDTPARGTTQESRSGVCKLCGAPERRKEDVIQRPQTVSPGSALPGSCLRFAASGESGTEKKGLTEERNRGRGDRANGPTLNGC